MSRLILKKSLAGLKAGMEEDSETRSSLVFQVLRIIKEVNDSGKHIDVLICENVSQIHSVDNMPSFVKILDKLEELGYQSKYFDINSKTMGIPQNRNRTFIVSVPKGFTISEPRPMKLEIRLKHLLDKNVDEKYYLSEAMIKYLTKEGTGTYNRKEVFERNLDPNKEIAATICTTSGSRAVDNYIPDDEKMIVGAELDINTYGQCKKAYSTDGLSPTLTTVQGGYQEAKICEEDDFQVIDPYNKRLTDSSLSGTIVTRQGSNQGSMIVEDSNRGGELHND